MGGVDKGLVALAGRPMVAHVSRALRAAGRRGSDQRQPESRPLTALRLPRRAGRGRRLRRSACRPARRLDEREHEFVVTVPCDSPFLPADLVARLPRRSSANGARLAVAKTFDQPHPVFALCRERAAGSRRLLESGGRKIDAWYGA